MSVETLEQFVEHTDPVESVDNYALMPLPEGRAVMWDYLSKTYPKTEDASQATVPWQRWFTKLNRCRALEVGWNGDNSAPPNESAVDNASIVLDGLHREEYEPTRIAASAMGGVAITRKVGNRKVLVECYNDGRVYYLFSDRGSGSMDVKQLMLDRNSLTAFIALMREFLHG